MARLEAFDRLDQRVVPGLVSRPEVVFFMIGLIALAAGVTRISLATAEQRPGERGEDQVVIPEGEALPDGPVQVGPPQGVDLEEYVATRTQTLGTLAGAEPGARTIAIVSLADYLTPDELEALLDDATPEVVGVRYHLAPGAEDAEQVLDDMLVRGRIAVEGRLRAADVVHGLRDVADEARAAGDELDALIDTTEDPEFSEVYQHDRDQLWGAAEQVGESGCECLYALEVIGTLRDLTELGQRSAVRLVDVAPPGAAGRRVTLVGLLPGMSGPFESIP